VLRRRGKGRGNAALPGGGFGGFSQAGHVTLLRPTPFHFQFSTMAFMRLNHRLNRRLGSLLTRRTDGRCFRRANLLAEACRAINLCLRQSRKMAAADPHLFGPHALDYYRDVLRMEKEQQVIQTALDKVYGTSPADAPRSSSVWREHYDIPPEGRKIFRKWFRENYGS
jgi:hypothetical protein